MWIAHPADRLNVIRGLSAPIILHFPFWYGFPEGYVTLIVFLIFALIGSTNYTLHLHIHRPFANNKAFNLVLDLAMGLTTGMMASNWRIQHRYGHHRGIDQPYRPRWAWETAEYSALGALSYSIRTIWPTFWGPLAESFRKGVLANVHEPMNFRWAFTEQVLLILAILALFVWQPFLVLWYLLPWYATIYFISRYVDYLNHYGCDEQSSNVYEHSNNSYSTVFNLACHNFGYHTAHHLRPTAHWTELSKIHERIAHRIPERCIKTVSWSCLLLPYHCIRSWQGKM